MKYICQKECFFDRRYLAGEVIDNDAVYKALPSCFKPERNATVEPEVKIEGSTTMTEVATKEKPKLPEIPDVLGKARTTKARSASAKK